MVRTEAAARSCTRRSGILCHPSSLPGRFGIGELGAHARNLVDFLAAAGQTVWQILPLGPTGYGDSPYQPFSAFAGNPLFIDLETLVAQGLLDEEDVVLDQPFSDTQVLYGPVIAFKRRVLNRAFENMRRRNDPGIRAQQEAFEAQNRDWLDDFALFMALKLRNHWAVWTDWDRAIALREPGALVYWREELKDEIDFQRYAQFLFDSQWAALRRYANERGVLIVGDMPIFMGHDSSEVWGNRELFQLDEHGLPSVVAGVPPDYFSATGQLWGNPHYRWDVLKAQGYSWWVRRFQRALSQVDMVRVDHFRGFAGYWVVPAHEETAIHGHWVKGPGADLFHVLQKELGDVPILAEDLGLITSDVVALRKEFDLPGMTVLQFAFDGDASSPHLPHHHEPRSICYTGTHDNDTTVGWFATRGEAAKHRVRVYTGSDGSHINWALIRLAMTSVAEMAIYPLQDVLGLGSEARLNVPGRPHGNWTWRYRRAELEDGLAVALRELALVTGRWCKPGTELTDVRPADPVFDET
ncbi:MAG: 4-alpha-glucanotransferase [Anaerolineae bacterium]